LKKIKATSLRWVFYVSQRFSRIDQRSRFAMTSVLPAVGIGFGVMALIIILSVMNGFQLESIESILEISSYHIRAIPDSDEDSVSLLNQSLQEPMVTSINPFYEAQGLLVGRNGRQSAALIRAIDHRQMYNDEGFAKQLQIYSGNFDLYTSRSIVLGSTLARNLGLRVGDSVNILALSGGADVDLFSENRVFTVTALFSCGYGDINAAFAFIPFEDGKELFGKNAVPTYGIKISNKDHDERVMQKLSTALDSVHFESWRSFNRSFFGALRVEKNILMMLALLIFVVVAVNIFNGMRRMVYERREEICVLSALGSSSGNIQLIFIMQGLIIGLSGAVPGLILGLFMSVNIDTVFTLIAKASYFFQYMSASLFNPESLSYIIRNSTYSFYAGIPARVYVNEVVFITLFGLLSAVSAAWLASTKVLSFKIAEVLRDE